MWMRYAASYALRGVDVDVVTRLLKPPPPITINGHGEHEEHDPDGQ